MKTVIIYASTHHGNTRKIAEAMADCISADLIDITENQEPIILEYDVIGFASGIYFQAYHKKITEFIQHATFSDRQKAFLANTCGMSIFDYNKVPRKLLKANGVPCLGSFQCRGYDTFGIFGKLGGIAKGRPNAADIENARSFIDKILRH